MSTTRTTYISKVSHVDSSRLKKVLSSELSILGQIAAVIVGCLRQQQEKQESITCNVSPDQSQQTEVSVFETHIEIPRRFALGLRMKKVSCFPNVLLVNTVVASRRRTRQSWQSTDLAERTIWSRLVSKYLVFYMVC